MSIPVAPANLQAPVLIVGGTAAYDLDLQAYAPGREAEILETPYGPSPPITLLQPAAGDEPVAFCSRHGPDRLQRSAAFVNHRALIWAAKQIGASAIFSWNGAGAIAFHLEVGDLVVPHDFLDFTHRRVSTFDDQDLMAAAGPAFHPAARAALLAVSPPAGHTLHTSGVYVCTEGPRLETTAEIDLYRRAGTDLVGMTLSPEVFLAQELGLAYASLCYITNYATGAAAGRPPRRQFGAEVAAACLPLLLSAAAALNTDH